MKKGITQWTMWIAAAGSWLLCAAAMQTRDSAEEETTRAIAMDLQAWVSDGRIDPRLEGHWQSDDAELSVLGDMGVPNHRLLISGDKVKPAFHLEVAGQPYVVICADAGDTGEIYPEVYAYRISEDGVAMQWHQVQPDLLNSGFHGLSELASCLAEKMVGKSGFGTELHYKRQ